MVRIRSDDIFIDSDSYCDAGNCYINGTIITGPITASFDIMAGRDGVAVAASVLIASAEFQLQNDQVAVATSAGIADAAARIS